MLSTFIPFYVYSMLRIEGVVLKQKGLEKERCMGRAGPLRARVFEASYEWS